LRAYLTIRRDAESDRLFITKFGIGIGPRAIQNVVAKYLNDAGITRARVHTLRHTFAAHMVKKGTKLDVVRQALGHESLETTSIYVELAHEQMDKELQENAL
jgi:integrase/recombinase XerC